MIMIMHVVRFGVNCMHLQSAESALCSMLHSGLSSSMRESESLSFSLRLHDYFLVFSSINSHMKFNANLLPTKHYLRIATRMTKSRLLHKFVNISGFFAAHW